MFILLGVIGCKNSQDFFEKIDEQKIGNSKVEQESEAEDVKDLPPTKDEICLADPKACDLKPIVTKSGVVTMLMAFGDLVNDKVVIAEGSARLLAQNAVKYASPIVQPKILVVKDYNNNGESKYDTEYIAKVLLSNYASVEVLNETVNGLSANDLVGYDLIWFNNPGHPMGNISSMKALINFKGGVILSGDDLTRGKNFSMEPLTGLKHIDNGASISCGGKTYNYDNNNTNGRRYQVKISTDFFAGIPEDLRSFEYGNDIDNSSISTTELKNKLEVLAYSYGAPGACGDNKRPSIIRYEK